jgi:hypothetical protein
MSPKLGVEEQCCAEQLYSFVRCGQYFRMRCSTIRVTAPIDSSVGIHSSVAIKALPLADSSIQHAETAYRKEQMKNRRLAHQEKLIARTPLSCGGRV